MRKRGRSGRESQHSSAIGDSTSDNSSEYSGRRWKAGVYEIAGCMRLSVRMSECDGCLVLADTVTHPRAVGGSSGDASIAPNSESRRMTWRCCNSDKAEQCQPSSRLSYPPADRNLWYCDRPLHELHAPFEPEWLWCRLLSLIIMRGLPGTVGARASLKARLSPLAFPTC